MALLYNAEITPSKIELLHAWLPSQPWCPSEVADLKPIGAYRFDDPAGEVGIETHLLKAADGLILQVPLTYRGAPLAVAGDALVGTMQHSVLGERWVYDACFDLVYAAALASAILTGGTHANLDLVTDSGPQRHEPKTRVAGSGAPGTSVAAISAVEVATDQTSTTIRSGKLELVVLRRPDHAEVAGAELILTGTWPGSDDPTVLALAYQR